MMMVDIGNSALMFGMDAACRFEAASCFFAAQKLNASHSATGHEPEREMMVG